MNPAPRALRLLTRARDAAPERPPWGLAAWSSEADGIAILLDGTAGNLNDAAIVLAQIPEPRTLAPSAPIVVLGTSARGAAAWQRLLGPRAVTIARAPRCGALLARGYVGIGAAFDLHSRADVVWGYTPNLVRATENRG